MERLNAVLDSALARMFKPQYKFAFAGVASVLIVAVMTFTKVEQPQCNDLACLEKSISDDELNTYLDKNSEAYGEEVFEMDFTNKTIEEQAFKDVMKGVTDEDLDNAILD
jgi:hypothetical protein